MEDSTTTIKVPFAMTKNQLVKAFYPVPEKELRSVINNIIIDNRRKFSKNDIFTNAQLIKKHTLLQCEIMELIEHYGTPNIFKVKK